MVNLEDLVKSFQTSIYNLLANIGFDTVESGPLKVSPKIVKPSKTIRIAIGASSRERPLPPSGPPAGLSLDTLAQLLRAKLAEMFE